MKRFDDFNIQVKSNPAKVTNICRVSLPAWSSRFRNIIELNYFCSVLYPLILYLSVFTAIEQEESDTTLCVCIEDSVVIVSLMFFCNSFSDEEIFYFSG